MTLKASISFEGCLYTANCEYSIRSRANGVITNVGFVA